MGPEQSIEGFLKAVEIHRAAGQESLQEVDPALLEVRRDRGLGRYAVAPDGTLTALGSTLVENNPASHPLDEGVSAGQHYLYLLANGLSQIVGYQVGADGALTQVATVPAAAASGGIGAS
jgi:hypothetical protein